VAFFKRFFAGVLPLCVFHVLASSARGRNTQRHPVVYKNALLLKT